VNAIDEEIKRRRHVDEEIVGRVPHSVLVVPLAWENPMCRWSACISL
jgi:hypothetical protein